ncbi:MAG: hypothetical protein HY014_16395 [Acidobacteria bacterium]|nr:hypothetical protein [Acidobacteriota bacterium]MBI3489711.1 hypothetical protein [Acidobacteriota bacterium]
MHQLNHPWAKLCLALGIGLALAAATQPLGAQSAALSPELASRRLDKFVRGDDGRLGHLAIPFVRQGEVKEELGGSWDPLYDPYTWVTEAGVMGSAPCAASCRNASGAPAWQVVWYKSPESMWRATSADGEHFTSAEYERNELDGGFFHVLYKYQFKPSVTAVNPHRTDVFAVTNSVDAPGENTLWHRIVDTGAGAHSDRGWRQCFIGNGDRMAHHPVSAPASAVMADGHGKQVLYCVYMDQERHLIVRHSTNDLLQDALGDPGLLNAPEEDWGAPQSEGGFYDPAPKGDPVALSLKPGTLDVWVMAESTLRGSYPTIKRLVHWRYENGTVTQNTAPFRLTAPDGVFDDDDATGPTAPDLSYSPAIAGFSDDFVYCITRNCIPISNPSAPKLFFDFLQIRDMETRTSSDHINMEGMYNDGDEGNLVHLYSGSALVATQPAGDSASAWVTNHPYHAGDKVAYLGAAYLCTFDHLSQPGWEPNQPQLWAVWKKL